MSSFKMENVAGREVLRKCSQTVANYSDIAFCTASIEGIPVYVIKNSDTGGNVPEGATTFNGGNWFRIPFNTFVGTNKYFDFDGNYLVTRNPGYYYITLEFTIQCTNSGSPSHEMTLAMMNQSGGDNNLYFPFTVTGTSQQYTYTGILPLNFYDSQGALHFSFNSSDTFTFKLTSISVNVSFYV